MRLLPVVLAATTLAACQSGAECSEEEPCGFGESCVEGTCVAKSCSSSQQCAMEQYCADGKCVDGCAEDTDCYPGDVCDLEATACVLGGCRSTSLDCDFKEFCDQATGECYEASGYYCRECEVEDDCGGNGNLCLYFGFEKEFCGVTCGSESDCPSGFTCVPVATEKGYSYQCITYCWLYDDEARQVPAPERGELRPVPVERAEDLQTCSTQESP